MSSVLGAADRLAVEDDRTAFNLAVWKKLLADPDLAALPFRIETDEHGQIIMSPPPAPAHGNKQSKIAHLLTTLMDDGEVVSECPISTTKGVKAADVAWCSDALWKESDQAVCFARSPEICVEVISPSNATSEIQEKLELYFEAGASEVWLCDEDGAMRFFLADTPAASVQNSAVCPDFPTVID